MFSFDLLDLSDETLHLLAPVALQGTKEKRNLITDVMRMLLGQLLPKTLGPDAIAKPSTSLGKISEKEGASGISRLGLYLIEVLLRFTWMVFEMVVRQSQFDRIVPGQTGLCLAQDFQGLFGG